MKTIVKTIFLIFLLSSVSYGAAISSNGTGGGDWSAGASWNGGVAPGDNDDATIVDGDTIVFDMDMSAYVTGCGLTIDSGGTLQCDTATGDYYYMGKADVDISGTLIAGTSTSVPLPSDVTFTIDLNGAFSLQIDDDTGSLQLYCGEPTNKYVKLTATEPAAETEMAVDTDVSSDWAVGDMVVLVDITSTEDTEEAEIDSMTATTITLTAGLTREKLSESYIFLRERNIKIINSTTYAIEQGSSGTIHVGAEIYDCDRGVYSTENATIAGTITPDGAYCCHSIDNSTFDGCAAPLTIAGNIYGFYGTDNLTTTSDSLVGGFARSFQNIKASTLNGIAAGSYFGVYSSSSIICNGDFIGVATAFYVCAEVILTGQTKAVSNTFAECQNITVCDTSIGGSAGGQSSTRDFQLCSSGKCFSTTFGATTEFDGYDNPSLRLKSSYLESSDHDNTENSYKAWVLGGVVTSQTASPPTGYDIWYEIACEDDTKTYPAFRQYETVVQPGTAIEVEGYIRNADNGDLTGYEPYIAIVDKFADPFVDSTQSNLDEMDIPEPDSGSEAGWQAVSVIWANQGDSPRNVIVRMVAEHDGGGDDVDIDTVWSIADYQDQIQSIYDMLPTDATYLMGSDDDDAHDGDIDAILTDTNEIQTDQADGGRLDLIWDGIWEDIIELLERVF